MKCIVAKNTGFCFGVQRAIQAARECAGQPHVYTYGEIIHNSVVVDELKSIGIKPVENLDLPAESTLVIRSHGVPPEVYEACAQKNIRVVDATCPFVKRIHEIVSEYKAKDYEVIVVGQHDHPEVVGIQGWCHGAMVIKDAAEAEALLKDVQKPHACVVAQTTINTDTFDAVCQVLEGHFDELVCKNTICSTTQERQREAADIARCADLMVVIGGKNSSNTKKLYEICKKNCENVVMIEKPDELVLEKCLIDDIIVGVVTGASTPDRIIREVEAIMTEFENKNPESAQEEISSNQEQETVSAQEVQEETSESAAQTEDADVKEETPAEEEEQAAQTEEDAEPTESQEKQEEASSAKQESEPAEAEPQESFADAFEKTMNRIRNGQIIKGTVVQIVNGEVSVNIGYKSDGLITKSEFSSDPGVIPEEVVKVGDEIEVAVLKVNDGEGNVLLSKKSVDARKAWDEIVADFENETVFDVAVTDVVKGGVITYIQGIQTFIPASHASNKYVENLEDLKGKPIRVSIIEIDKSKKRVIASARKVLMEEAEQKKKELFEQITAGTIVHGIARRITDFGVFVDIGGIDGLLHVTDIAWSRVNHPSDIISVGQELDLKILAVDKEKERVSLGLKQTLPHPWETAAERYTVGTNIEGKVVRIGSFGAFVALEPGIDGLIHISQVAPRRIEKVEDELSVGDAVTVKVLNVDTERRRISLSRRAVLAEQNRRDEPAQEDKPRYEREERVKIPPVQHSTVSLSEFFPPIEIDDEE
ncbi:MAG: bifunctional 4-hydroxy-3-methylbut-2-enyl diphosphate reductase/30S ribosomal protein S1 [Christensenellales bacterium]|jgi:(E)-4-hydroxy-3-methyl-but-2-enyl pyrophosphate reductase